MAISLKRRILAAVTMLMALLTTAAEQELLIGLSGKTLADNIVELYKPQQILESTDDIYAAVSAYSRDENRVYRDFFSRKGYSDVHSLMLLRVASEAWWGVGAANRRGAEFDLNNIVGANSEVAGIRGDLPPGEVSDVFFENGYWRAGECEPSGLAAGVYEPADELKGDFARIYMFMALMYSENLWCGRAPMLYIDGGYPFLSGYGRELLMKWHRQDPVDEFELKRNSEISKRQGAGNPFVELPELAEYLWGAHVGENYTENAGDEPEKDCDVFLKGKYSRKTDGHICFKSLYVSAEAAWTFDGKPVGKRLELDSVGEGKHEIGYKTPTSRGKMIVIVKP